jgi:putative membrane protein
MTKRNVTPAILVAVVVSVLLAGLVAARPDTYTNSNMDQNSNGSNTSGQANSTSGSKNSNASMLDSSDRKFMMEAAMGGMEEVELGRIAAERGTTDAVKQFGQRMVDDHTKANEELMQIASTKGVTLPTTLDDKHKADVAKMSNLSGAEFDRMYIKEAGVKDHNKAAKLFQREADRGKDADLKAFAAKTLPTIQEHLRMAQGMETSMRASKSTSSRNSNMSGNMNSSGNSNMSNSNMSNRNMSNSNGNMNMSGNDNTSGNSNMTNSNGNSNMTNSNGNSNNPR